MGEGNVTTRGIIFQALVSILNSLENMEWTSICVEPVNEVLLALDNL